MADLTITAANVIPDAGARITTHMAAVAISPAQAVYELAGDEQKVGLYDADGTGEVKKLYGLALNSAAVGQPVAVMIGGTLTVGATVVAGTIYLGSDTPGGIRPAADLNSGDVVGVLGVGISTSKIALHIWNTGATKA